MVLDVTIADAATPLDEGGLSIRETADQLGHANVSMTQNVYFAGVKPRQELPVHWM